MSRTARALRKTRASMFATIERRWSSPKPSRESRCTDDSWPPQAFRSFFIFMPKGDIVRLTLLIIFGALGTLARYGMQGLVQQRTGGTFPWGTLAVNLLGCLLLG